MGQKYVTVDGNIVQEAFDEDNNNVPVDAVTITDVEFAMFNNPRYNFGDFEIVNGSLALIAEADDNMKARIIDGFDSPKMLKAFAEIVMDELNILRAGAGLDPRTMAQLKTARKNKLS